MRCVVACSQMAAVAHVEHKDVASALALWGAFLSVAVAMGLANSVAGWTDDVSRVLEDILPAGSENLTEEMVSSIAKQKEYPMGTEIRDAVIGAYWAVQEILVIWAVCFVAMAFVCIFFWRSMDVRKGDNPQDSKKKGVVW